MISENWNKQEIILEISWRTTAKSKHFLEIKYGGYESNIIDCKWTLVRAWTAIFPFDWWTFEWHQFFFTVSNLLLCLSFALMHCCWCSWSYSNCVSSNTHQYLGFILYIIELFSKTYFIEQIFHIKAVLVKLQLFFVIRQLVWCRGGKINPTYLILLQDGLWPVCWVDPKSWAQKDQ